MERIKVANHDVYLTLAKNANGYTEVLRAVLGDGRPRRIMLGLNDFEGKQPDTSWIWDVDFESVCGLIPSPVVTGNRAYDLTVRLKYAGWLGATKETTLTTEPDPVRAFQRALARTPLGRAALAGVHVDRAAGGPALAAAAGVCQGSVARARAACRNGTTMKITLGCLYPDIMSTYGDRGNVATIRRRCEWRGIAVDLRELRLGDRAEPDDLDLIVIGSGGESQQRLVAADLNEVKGSGIREAVHQGAAALAVGSGFELFGQLFAARAKGPNCPVPGCSTPGPSGTARSSATSTPRSPRPGRTEPWATWSCDGRTGCWSASRITPAART